MTDRIFIEVADRHSDETYVVAVTTPFKIGKQAGVGNAILLDARFADVSRVHGVVERDHGRLYYTDQSSNGSLADGAVVHRARVAMTDRFAIEIEPYVLRRVDAEPHFVVITGRDLKEKARGELLPGRGLAVRRVSNELALVDLNRWSQRNESNLLRLLLSANKPHVAVETAPTVVLRNRSRLPAGSLPLNSGDVLTIEDRRIEFLAAGAAYTVCANTACHLLNPHGAEANCRWCGYHLAGTGAVSRVII